MDDEQIEERWAAIQAELHAAFDLEKANRQALDPRKRSVEIMARLTKAVREYDEYFHLHEDVEKRRSEELAEMVRNVLEEGDRIDAHTAKDDSEHPRPA